MNKAPDRLRDKAEAIWRKGVASVDPYTLVLNSLQREPLRSQILGAKRIWVAGGGKGGAAMAAGVEAAFPDHLDQINGWVNIPAGPFMPLKKIHLHPARPAGSNHPTREGVEGSMAILERVDQATSGDIVLCLLSGGGSALLPAPVEGITLEDKQNLTRLLHQRGASIGQMNCVRKHLSLIKGGRLAEKAVRNHCPLVSLILSDVVGDPLDVIASGPTAADPTTFAQALEILENLDLKKSAPAAIVEHLQKGQAGLIGETPKHLPSSITNLVIGNNAIALASARKEAEILGYRVLSLGSYLEGETSQVALALAGVVQSIERDGIPVSRPVCLLSGGETTVTLLPDSGKGGRNQEMALALAMKLGKQGLSKAVVLCAGSDGEDGPTDAAGAFADLKTFEEASQKGLDPVDFLRRHDAWNFFQATGDLFKTGLTGTNVMDIQIVLLD